MQDHAHLVKRSEFKLDKTGKPSKTVVKTLCGGTIKLTDISQVERPDHDECFNNYVKPKTPAPHFWVVAGTEI